MIRGIALAASLALASYASAETLFSNIGAGIAPGAPIFAGEFPNRTLEDVTFGSSNASGFTLTGVNVGFNNIGTANATFDVLLDFYDTVDYAQPIVASGVLATDVRLAVINALPGADETMPVALFPAVSVSDNTVGVAVRFVLPNTNTPATNILPLFKDAPVEIGTSAQLFAHDSNNNNIFAFEERFTWQGGGFPAANMYLQLFGEANVPEPAVFGCVPAIALLLRRRGR